MRDRHERNSHTEFIPLRPITDGEAPIALSKAGKPLTPEEFVVRAIETLRNPPYKGIHTVFSGFNAAFREYFPGLDPVEVTSELARDGKIVIRPVKGGVMIYKPNDVKGSATPRDTLRKMGLDQPNPELRMGRAADSSTPSD